MAEGHVLEQVLDAYPQHPAMPITKLFILRDREKVSI